MPGERLSGRSYTAKNPRWRKCESAEEEMRARDKGLFEDGLDANAAIARKGRRPMVLFVDFGGAGEGGGDAGADIVGSDVAFEFGLMHERGGLLAGTAKQQRAARSMERVGEIAQCAEPGGINRSHVAKPENDDGRQRVNGAENLREFVSCAEQEWPVDAKNRGIGRNILALQYVDPAVLHVILRDAGNRGSARNFADEHESGEDHADFDGEREIGHDGEENSCGDRHALVVLRVPAPLFRSGSRPNTLRSD